MSEQRKKEEGMQNRRRVGRLISGGAVALGVLLLSSSAMAQNEGKDKTPRGVVTLA